MKALIFCLFLATGLIGLSSCKKRQIKKIKSSVTEGTWRITYYSDNGVNETSDFSGDVFTFKSNGTLLVTGNHSATGTWSVGKESDDDSGDRDIEFIINLPTPAMEELNDDWEVEKHSDSQLELKDESGNDNGDDQLIFTKN